MAQGGGSMFLKIASKLFQQAQVTSSLDGNMFRE